MTIEALIHSAAELVVSDVHLVYGVPPKFRVSGELEDMPGAAAHDPDYVKKATFF